MKELEIEIIASFLSYPQTCDEFLAQIPKECFSFNARRAIEILSELMQSQSVSKNAFMLKLDKKEQESDFFIEVLSTLPNPNVLKLTQSFYEQFLLHKQKEAGLKLIEASENNALLEISTLIPQVAFSSYKSMEQWQEYYESKPAMPSYKTGISFLDSVFDGGICGAQLVLISGDPEAGKTTLGLQILEYMAKSQKVCFFSFEFPIYTYLNRKAKDKKLNRQNLFIIDEGYEIYQVAQNIKNLYKQGVRVFLIDSQMRLVSPNGRNMEEEESMKFSILARLCHSLGIVVLLIVQTSKGDRDNPMGSKKGGHEASIIIRIEHDKPSNENTREFSEDSRIVILKKNKQTGKHYKERVGFDSVRGTFGEYNAHESYEEMEVIPL